MKRTMMTLSALAGLSLTAIGGAYAAENPGGEASRLPVPQDMIDCHDPSNASAAALRFEAPWISLALANAERISLTEEQARDLDALRSEFRHEAERRRHDIVTAEQTLQELLAEDAVDVERVKEQLGEVGRLRDDLRLRRIETLLAGRGVLSAGQLAELQAMAIRPADGMHGAGMNDSRTPAEGAPASQAM